MVFEPASVYPISALQKNQREVREAAKSKLLRITENGASAYVFCSEEVLEQTIERAVLLSNSSVLDSDDFYMDVPPVTVSHPVTLEEMEKQFISEVLAEKKGNLTLCAQQLNISRQTLYNKMKKYNL